MITAALAFGSLTVMSGLGAGAAWESARDRGRPVVPAFDDDTLELVGARGDEVSFYLRGSSQGRKWSTFGLNMELEEGHRLEVVPAREQDWDDTVRGSLGSFDAVGSFVIPDLEGPEERTVQGVIVGSMVIPRSIDEREFRNETESVEVPVALQLTSPEEAAALEAEAKGLMSKLFPILVVTSIASATLTLALSLFASRYKKKHDIANMM